MKRKINLGRELKKLERECDNYTNRDWYSWYNRQRISTGPGRHGNGGTSGNHPNYSIIEYGQNTEKSPGDLRILAITQTPVKENQLTLI